MPNNNPAGIFQPMDQHPSAYTLLRSVGQDASLNYPLAAVSEHLLSEAPPAGVARSISFGRGLVTNGGANLIDLSVYLKDAQGRSYIVHSSPSEPGPVAPLFNILAFSPMYMMEGDFTGLYMRYAAGGAIVGAHVSYLDMRNIVRVRTELTDSFQAVSPPSTPGTTAVAPTGLNGGSRNSAYVFNFDTNPQEVQVELRDESNSIAFIETTTLPAATDPLTAVGVNLFSTAGQGLLFTAIPPGWSLQARLLAAAANPVLAFTYWSLANQCPVRPDQGGAY